jgi:hypothetical protein
MACDFGNCGAARIRSLWRCMLPRQLRPFVRSYLVAFILCCSNSRLGAADISDLTLTDGRVFKSAVIIAIGELNATVRHAGGVTAVPVDDVPLDVLARAQMRLEADAGNKKRESEALSQRIAANDTKEKEEPLSKSTAADARVRAQSKGPTIPTGRTVPDADKKLLALKAQFPAGRRETVIVRLNGRRSRIDKIEIEIPATDIWLYYHGTVQTATVQSLPFTLARIDERIVHDLAEMAKHGAQNDEATRAQAQRSTRWVNSELRAYLKKLRELQSN